MTPTEVAAKLQHFNDWRRGHHDEQPDPRVICEAIDAAVEMIDRLEAAEKERDAAELMSLALRAKIEQMERQGPVAEIGQQYTLLFAGSGSITGVVKRHGLKIGDKLYALPGAKGEEE